MKNEGRQKVGAAFLGCGAPHGRVPMELETVVGARCQVEGMITAKTIAG